VPLSKDHHTEDTIYPIIYGFCWSNTRRRRDKGVWERLMEVVIAKPDYEWLMIDASHCKAHHHASGAKDGNQDMARAKGGLTGGSTGMRSTLG